MNRNRKISITVGLVLIIILLVGYGALTFWSRGGRLSPEKSRSLVTQAWKNTDEYKIDGAKVVRYRIDNRVYNVKPDLSQYPRAEALETVLAELFPGISAENADTFLAGLGVKNTGRVRISGRTCEKIRLVPTGYTGSGVELTIDPDGGYLLGWSKLDSDGKLIRGWNYTSIDNISKKESPSGVKSRLEELINISPFMESRGLIGPDELDLMSEHGRIALPGWVPDGFKLSGGRWVRTFGPSTELQEFLPGLGIGRLNRNADGGGPGPGGPGEGHFQAVYSDGLNTISIMFIPQARLGGLGGGRLDPAHVNEILSFKGKEMHRLFHVSMISRHEPGLLFLGYGEVEPRILKQMLDSISVDKLVPLPLEQGFEPDPNQPGPMGPGREGFGPGPGFRDRPEGPGRRRGPGAGPPGQGN